MSFLNRILSATVQTVLLPIEVAKDVATLGGSITDQHVPYTMQRLSKIGDQIERAIDDLD